MEKIIHNCNFRSSYKNGGQAKEQWLRFVHTGKVIKADNKPYYMGGDIGSIQVKSPKATVCSGYDIKAYIARDTATMYAFVTHEYVTYYMSPAEWIAFVEVFGYRTQESGKNNGTPKIRLLDESKRMRVYLDEHSR